MKVFTNKSTLPLLKAFLPTLIAGALVTSCATPPPTPTFSFTRVEFNNCDDEQIKKLSWAVAYMKAAAASPAFRNCLKAAIEGAYGPGTAVWGGGEYLYTYQESSHVGPYLPCAVTNGQFREPEFVYQNSPFLFQDRLLAYEAALAVSQSFRALRLTCTTLQNVTARAPVDHGYFRPVHDTPYFFTEQVELGARVFTQFPDHQTEDYGEAARFGTMTPAYQIDELAGIILHEILHNYGFEHGTSANECGYRAGFDLGRFHSLLEIVEACMSEVVEASIALCTEECEGGKSVRIVSTPIAVTNINIPHSCDCIPYD